jgi:hypothetical protein
MADYEIDELRGFEWMQSRVPALDALVHFTPDGERDAAVEELALNNRSRWYPMQGGTRVVVSMDREPKYDASKWTVEKDAWDHEHCEHCGDHIPAMTLCWVTKSDPYVLICDACHATLAVVAGDA